MDGGRAVRDRIEQDPHTRDHSDRQLEFGNGNGRQGRIPWESESDRRSHQHLVERDPQFRRDLPLDRDRERERDRYTDASKAYSHTRFRSSDDTQTIKLLGSGSGSGSGLYTNGERIAGTGSPGAFGSASVSYTRSSAISGLNTLEEITKEEEQERGFGTYFDEREGGPTKREEGEMTMVMPSLLSVSMEDRPGPSRTGTGTGRRKSVNSNSTVSGSSSHEMPTGTGPRNGTSSKQTPNPYPLNNPNASSSSTSALTHTVQPLKPAKKPSTYKRKSRAKVHLIPTHDPITGEPIPGGGEREKKTRQSQSCDGCRVRKVKCIPLEEGDWEGRAGRTEGADRDGDDGDGDGNIDMDPVGDYLDSETTADPTSTHRPSFSSGRTNSSGVKPTPNISALSAAANGGLKSMAIAAKGLKRKASGIVPCKACHVLGLVCSFDYVPRKRGPPNLYMKRLRDATKSDDTDEAKDAKPIKETKPTMARRPSDLITPKAEYPNILRDGPPPRSQLTPTSTTTTIPFHQHSYAQPSAVFPSAADFIPRRRSIAGQTSPGGLPRRDRRSGSPMQRQQYMDGVRPGPPSAYPGPGPGAALDNIMGPPRLNGQYLEPPSYASNASALTAATKMALDPDAMLGIPAPSPSETGLSSILRYTNQGVSPGGVSGLGLGGSGLGHYEHALTPTSSFMRSTAVEDGPEDEIGPFGMIEDESRQWPPRGLMPRLPALDLRGNPVNANGSQYHSSPSEVMDEHSSAAGSSRMQSDGRELRSTLPSQASGFGSIGMDNPIGSSLRPPSIPPSGNRSRASGNQFSVPVTDAFAGMGQYPDRNWTPQSGTLSGFGRTGNNSSAASGSRGIPLQSPISSLMNASNYSASSQPPDNPLDAIVPRSLLHLVIGLFFDYVYPLIPCLHRPTFYQDLMNKREERPGEEEWTSLVLAVVASTLVQVPKAFVPLSRKDVRDLAYRCYQSIRKWSVDGYKNVTVTTVTITYLMTVYNFVRGEHACCHASLGETQALCIFLRLHEEESYMYLNPIERELRRRIFFLTFGADKSEAVLLGRPVKMREEDCYALRLPEEIDDEFITATSYLSQPLGVTSIITGFNAATRVMCLIGRVMIKHREDKRDPPSGTRLQSRLDEISRLLEEIMSVMDNCPPALRLKSGMDSRAQSPAGGWDAEAAAQLQALFFDPTTDRGKAKDAFIVQQGNIYVTQQLGRFVLLQYRNDLLALRNGASAAHANTSWQGIGGVPLGAVGGTATPSATEDEKLDREGLCYDMLTVLHSLPIQCIAVNGPSLVTKIRYQAASLLDSVASNAQKDESRGEADASTTLRAQTYLLDFLSILSEIEKHYLLDDEEPGM